MYREITSTGAERLGEATVYLYVQNVGNASGTPSCTIHLSSPGGAYKGFDVVTPEEPLTKNHTLNDSGAFHDTITVTNEGAAYVDVADSTLVCS